MQGGKSKVKFNVERGIKQQKLKEKVYYSSGKKKRTGKRKRNQEDKEG